MASGARRSRRWRDELADVGRDRQRFAGEWPAVQPRELPPDLDGQQRVPTRRPASSRTRRGRVSAAPVRWRMSWWRTPRLTGPRRRRSASSPKTEASCVRVVELVAGDRRPLRHQQPDRQALRDDPSQREGRGPRPTPRSIHSDVVDGQQERPVAAHERSTPSTAVPMARGSDGAVGVAGTVEQEGRGQGSRLGTRQAAHGGRGDGAEQVGQDDVRQRALARAPPGRAGRSARRSAAPASASSSAAAHSAVLPMPASPIDGQGPRPVRDGPDGGRDAVTLRRSPEHAHLRPWVASLRPLRRRREPIPDEGRRASDSPSMTNRSLTWGARRSEPPGCEEMSRHRSGPTCVDDERSSVGSAGRLRPWRSGRSSASSCRPSPRT